MSETQWPHTLYISLNQGKLDSPVSQIRGSCLDSLVTTASFQKLDVLIFKTVYFSFYWLVSNVYFLGDKYKSSPLPHLEGVGATHENLMRFV
jgi:hypothetical protein